LFSINFAFVKKAFLISLMLIFAFQSFYSTGITLWFHLNRSYIAQKLCVNKAKPELKCKGNCVLKKKLKEAENQQEEQGTQQLKEWVSVSPFIISHNLYQFNPAIQSQVRIPQMEENYHFLTHFAIFHPPILS
jgi:hypothetical protein